MAYTRPWDTAVSGAVPANTIDTIFTNKLSDIAERLLVLFTNMALDPLVVRDEIIGKATKKIIIPNQAFFVEPTDPSAMQYQGYRVQAPSALGTLRAPLILPGGVSVTRIRWLVNSDDAAVITMKMQGATFQVGTANQDVNIQTKASAGEEMIDSGTLVTAIPISNGSYYWLTIDKLSGGFFYLGGVEITYNTPDSRSTY